MNDADEETELAALLAAGALTGAEREAALRRERDDSAFAAEVAGWEAALAPLALDLPQLAPPEGLLGEIDARLDARERFARLAKKLQEPLRQPEGDWIVIATGLRCKLLEQYPEERRHLILFEAEPGALYPAHTHVETEELYMISGDLLIGEELELRPGDFHVSRAGSRHPDLTTRRGCRCLICKEI